MKRRTLLQGGAGLVVVFGLGGCALPVFPKRPASGYADALGWIRHHDGRYTLALPRIEMGQQIATALKQVACAELGVPWDAVALALPDTGAMARVRATVGSESVRDFALPLAQACATLREALARGDTEGWRKTEPVPASALRAFRRDTVRPTPALVHGREIVTGAALYVADVRPPGLLYGRVLRAPTSPELPSRPAAWNEAAARAVPGFVALVRDERLRQASADGLGIVARTPGALDRIAAALALQWHTEGSGDDASMAGQIDIDAQRESARPPNAVLQRGRLDDAAPWDLDLRIDIPLAAHAAIEPRAAVAALDAAGVLDLWVGSQDAYYQRDVVCKALGRNEARVRVHPCRVGGAFGGKTICTVELEAALLCEAVGAPVKVQWTRAQEYRQGFHRPPSSHRIRARLRNGHLHDWQHHFASSHILFTAAGIPGWLQRITDVVAGDPGVARGAVPGYRMPNADVRFALARVPVFTGPWRGLGAGPNGLAIESAIDECARAAGADPVAFRLAHIEDPRLARVLRAAVHAAPAPPAPPATPMGARVGRGVACGTYKQNSHAAVVADVAVAADGQVRVIRLTCAHDCGHVIDADTVRAQCEGNLVWGLGMALGDALSLRDGAVVSDSFAAAPIPRIDALPPMQVVLVDEGEAPGGAGETVIVAAAAAIANAVRAATGRRPTRFPLAAADFARRLEAMDDFASAAMMRIVRAGLQRQGLAAPPLPPAQRGRVALPDKRAQLQALWQAHGPGVIARLGEAVHGLHDDPMLTAFAPADGPFDLLQRWQRLERFVHSRHRVQAQATGPHALRWQHVSLRQAAPPDRAEDLLVAGLLLALAQRVGVQGLRARPVGTRHWLFDGGWGARSWPANLHTWEWRWDGGQTAPPAAPATTPLALLQADPSRGWTLPHLAQALCTAPRTLQRQLAREGHSFSRLLAQARLNHAAHRLTGSDAPLAEVGYLSGYADQPHFTRQFHAHTGLTPAQFRAQFRAQVGARFRAPALSRSASPR